MFRIHFSVLCTLSLLTGCATPRLAMDAGQPASASAPEAAPAPARATLRPDANTLRTRELLAQRERQAQAAESETLVDEATPSAAVPGTSGHENP